MWYDALLRFAGTSMSAQLEKPTGWIGRLIISRFLDKGNAQLNEFCIGRMNLTEKDRVLEIGFGSGRTIADMARTVEFVAGVDFSPEMVESAKSWNRRAIAEGKVDIRNAAVSALPFDDASFDKVYTANTIYFWPRPAQDAREIMRVIKPGGKLYLGFRPRHIMEQLPKQIIDSRFTPYSPDELGKLFTDAGFPQIEIESRVEDGALDSYCAIITRPAS
ncbi:MAG: class I SAM-dependent methyltransferase [bacterium]|nr:class I SAM-dependent methyltransferase [bacterium]